MTVRAAIERGEGFGMELSGADGSHSCFFFPFGFYDNLESIYAQAVLELTRFMIEEGYLCSADGKNTLGVTDEPAF